MANQASNNQEGRGLPPYLLWRYNSDSTDYSDGASGIFLSSIATVSTKGTSSPAMSIDTCSVSSACTWSTITDPYAMPVILNSTELDTNSSRNVFFVNEETRTIRSMCGSIDDGNETTSNTIHLNESVNRENDEDSSNVISLKNIAMTIAPFLTNYSNESMDMSDNNNLVSSSYTDPESMFSSTVPNLVQNEEEDRSKESTETMQCDDHETESIIVLPDHIETTTVINYDRCCLMENEQVSTCGSAQRHCYDWPEECISFANLAERDIRPYLKHLRVISDVEEDNIIINEKNLIANRLLQKNILIDESMWICPKHRSSFGIHWIDIASLCSHPDHVSKQRSKAADCRRAKLPTCSRIEAFPIGGRLCSKHRKMVCVTEDSHSNFMESEWSNESQFIIEDTRDTMNRVLAEANISPIRSQTRKKLQHQSKSSLRRLLSKLNRGTDSFRKKLAEALVQGESKELIELAELGTDTQKYQMVNAHISNEIVHNLKQIYDTYVANNMPFVEQVRLIALLPRSWSYEDIMKTFGCSRHAIKTAHRIQADNEYILKSEKESQIRQRADPNKIKHFVSWLVESNTLVSGTYGLTTLRMDSGEKIELSKQILQLQKTHAIAEYKKYCEETDFEGLCSRKLFDILTGLKPTQQRIVAGLDDFVVEGIEAWHSLSGIVDAMAIPQSDRKRLLQQIAMAEQYQKTAHSGHCSNNSDCITHCTTFGLSDANCSQHYSNCTQQHTFDCPDCLNIILTLDEIDQKIKNISHEEIKRETKYDFENAAQHIIEWSRHNLRAAQQNAAKNKIISEMKSDEAFCTFDWGQKILPQEYREKQSTYFGKKGMSVLVGSFVWKNSTTQAVVSSSPSISSLSTESYILALTTAAQTDLDSLSASEIILKQFKEDHTHVKKLHKRTDNAGNFSSHATPEVEKLICDRIGVELLTRDYSEVQKGKDICDRVCGVAKARMRSWASIGNDILNANDIKEGMEYAGGVKNTKIAVAQIMSGAGQLGKTNVPNVSTIRSIQYHPRHMKIFKASDIGDGISIPYKKINFETNMRLISSFTVPINEKDSTILSNKRSDRNHHQLFMCSVDGCTSTFESSEDLDIHIAGNLHKIPPTNPRTANDIARYHLIETVRSTNAQSHQETNTIRKKQSTSSVDISNSVYYQHFTSVGWALRIRKHTNPMSEKAKKFIEDMWIDCQTTRSKLTPELVQQQMRSQRDNTNDMKLFQPHEYATINQIKYRFRKLAARHEVTAKQELIAELMEENTD